MGMKVFLFTSLLILWITCDVNSLTTFGKKKVEDVVEEGDQLKLNESAIVASSNRQTELEDLRKEFEAAINGLRSDIKQELDAIKTTISGQKDKLPDAANDVDDAKSCQGLQVSYDNCEFAMLNESNKDGLYLLNFAPLAAYCQRYEQKGWTIIFRRHFTKVPADNARFHNWNSYRNGFGNLNGDHWLGLETMHQMTKDWVYELWMQLKFVNGSVVNLRNGFFKVGSESEGYALEKGQHLGYDVEGLDYGDILSSSYGIKFSTYDADNDNVEANCAKTLDFAWWYNKCNESGLMGRNLNIVTTDSNGEEHSEVIELEYIHMAIRLENV